MSESDRTPPESFLLLKFGANVYTKDGKEDSFRFDDASADALIAEFNSRSRDLVIDFEHSTLSGNEQKVERGNIDQKRIFASLNRTYRKNRFQRKVLKLIFSFSQGVIFKSFIEKV